MKEIEWEDVEKIMCKIIERRMTLLDGVAYIDKILMQYGGLSLIKKIDIKRLETEFNEWLRDIVVQNKLPSNVKTLYFGSFCMCDQRYNNGKETTTVYFSGSPFSPDEDDDWACWGSNTFLPESRYVVLTDFCLLDKLVRKKELHGNFEILLYNGILGLLVSNIIVELTNSWISGNNFLHVGFGADGGATFVIGKLSNKGLE